MQSIGLNLTINEPFIVNSHFAMNSDYLHVQLHHDCYPSLPLLQSACVHDWVAFINPIIDEAAPFQDINSIRYTEEEVNI